MSCGFFVVCPPHFYSVAKSGLLIFLICGNQQFHQQKNPALLVRDLYLKVV